MSPAVPEFFSYVQLAARWHVSVSTIQQWVCADRKAGLKIAGRFRCVNGLRREFLIRDDAAAAIYERHIAPRVQLR